MDYYGLNPKDIDILMGTFTKSFGASGGYIAGSTSMIRYLRTKSQSSIYPTSMSPPVCQQIITSMTSILDPNGDGLLRVKQLARNSRYFRRRLMQMGFIVYGHDDSPIIPLLVFMPAKVRAIVVECLKCTQNYHLSTREEITRENYVKPHHLLFFHPTIKIFKSPADEIKTNQSQRQMNV